MDHYREAERLLAQAAEVPAEGAATLVARAHVHAILALADRGGTSWTTQHSAPDQAAASPGARPRIPARFDPDIGPDEASRAADPSMPARFDPGPPPRWRSPGDPALLEEQARRRAADEQLPRARDSAADRDEPRGV